MELVRFLKKLRTAVSAYPGWDEWFRTGYPRAGSLLKHVSGARRQGGPSEFACGEIALVLEERRMGCPSSGVLYKV